MVFVVNAFEERQIQVQLKLSLCPNKTGSDSMQPNFINAHKEACSHLNNVIIYEGEFSLILHTTVYFEESD